MVITDQMGGALVTDFSGFSNGSNASIDYASLFNGLYLMQSFSLVRNNVVVAGQDKILPVIEWTKNGFTLDLTKVDPSFATPSQELLS
ncbi:Uncharacterised protein [Streptococcus acidominimus]|uniref:Uncharacterized protein n=1 Tax=Streptococcus acidominimus TaxID=1326 RepID=A0A239X8R6_STRAI|nr:hypothetical protein [Streptococcus acidominimus]SNV43111.1 Uncharacterised protein [Streptococcus acidominimus]